MRFTFRRDAEGAALVHPLQPVPRTAVVAPGFGETRFVKSFPNGWTEEFDRFRPTSVAGPIQALRALRQRGVELQHAVIAFTSDLDSPLSEHNRDWLWDNFGVPVFEQVLGPRNRLLAMECEAHEGLHLLCELPHTDVDRTPCGCGSTLPRLMISGRKMAEPLRAALAAL